ncbi:MAG: DUF6758 family protein [Nocardioides sp.]
MTPGPGGSLSAGCPRCTTPVLEVDQTWHCPEHGLVPPLWRSSVASYDAFVEHLAAAGHFPTYLPWPMSPGWHVTDFGVVGSSPQRSVATVTCCSGSSDLDGAVDVMVISEEAGTGLGSRCAGTPGNDPGLDVGDGPPSVHVRVGTHEVALWSVSTSSADGDLDRAVLGGETAGRWLWLVLRPASALLLLRNDWILRDVSGVGPPLVEMPFGGPPPHW